MYTYRLRRNFWKYTRISDYDSVGFFWAGRGWYRTQGFTLARQALYYLSHSASPYFVIFFFGDRGSWTICLGWFQTVILLISASWVARITGVSCSVVSYQTFHTILLRKHFQKHSSGDIFSGLGLNPLLRAGGVVQSSFPSCATPWVQFLA
jgi:hypothetical protein